MSEGADSIDDFFKSQGTSSPPTSNKRIPSSPEKKPGPGAPLPSAPLPSAPPPGAGHNKSASGTQSMYMNMMKKKDVAKPVIKPSESSSGVGPALLTPKSPAAASPSPSSPSSSTSATAGSHPHMSVATAKSTHSSLLLDSPVASVSVPGLDARPNALLNRAPSFKRTGSTDKDKERQRMVEAELMGWVEKIDLLRRELAFKEEDIVTIKARLAATFPCYTCGLFGLQCDLKEPCTQCVKSRTTCSYRTKQDSMEATEEGVDDEEVRELCESFQVQSASLRTKNASVLGDIMAEIRILQEENAVLKAALENKGEYSDEEMDRVVTALFKWHRRPIAQPTAAT